MKEIVNAIIGRPVNLDESGVKETMKRLYGLDVLSYKELNSYHDRNYYVKVRKHGRNLNHNINGISTGISTGICTEISTDINGSIEKEYVLKILNKEKSKNVKLVEGVNFLLQFLNHKNIPVSSPQQNHNGHLYTRVNFVNDDYEEECIVRLFDYLPGDIILCVPNEPKLLYEVGKIVAQMDIALKDCHHDFFIHRTKFDWSFKQVPDMIKYAHHVADDSDRRIVREVIDRFEREIVPVMDRLQTGVIHGDVNEGNILVTRPTTDSDYSISAIIDFENAESSYLVFEVGITIAYLMTSSNVIDCLDVGGHVLAGYLTGVELNTTEREILHVAVAARLVQSLLIGLNAYSLDPSNPHVVITQQFGWSSLRKIWGCDRDDLYTRWNAIIEEYQNNNK